MARKVRSLEQSMRNMQGLEEPKSVSYKDLCMFLDVHLPLGFKMPKFDKYEGHGDPVAYLKKFCNQLRGHLLSTIGSTFVEVITVGEMVESRIKFRKIISQTTLKATTQTIQSSSGSFGENKRKEDVATIMLGPRQKWRGARHSYAQSQSQIYVQDPYNHPRHYIPPQNLLYFTPSPQYSIHNAQPYARAPSYPQWRAPTPQDHLPIRQTYPSPSRINVCSKLNNEKRQKLRDSFTLIGESYTSLFQKLRKRDMITPLLGYTPDPQSRNFDPNVRCVYHYNVQDLNTEDCRALKREIERMIQDKLIMVKDIDSGEGSSHADV
ncbi:hypothetical protein P3L10_012473 [Capsicum annuum]